MSKYDGTFALLDPDAQYRLISSRCGIVEKMIRSTPQWQLGAITDLYNEVLNHDNAVLQFTELGALIDLLTDEQTAQVQS